jgi:hypothetical protein
VWQARSTIGTVRPPFALELAMLYQILMHTPLWVWALLAALLALGVKQSRPGRIRLARTVVLPLAMAALSLSGTVSAFGATPLVLTAWLLAALPLGWGMSRTAPPAGTRYDADERVFRVTGSWWPLALMMGIFLLKYAVAVTLVQAPGLAHAPAFAVPAALLYGAFSGCFFGRSARLWRLVRRDAAAPAGGLVV